MKTSDADYEYLRADAAQRRKLDADIGKATKEAYSTVTAADRRAAGPTTFLNKIGKL